MRERTRKNLSDKTYRSVPAEEVFAIFSADERSAVEVRAEQLFSEARDKSRKSSAPAKIARSVGQLSG
jgi:hypothetical protein